MSSNPSDPTPPAESSLQSMLARLRSLEQERAQQQARTGDDEEEVLPVWDAPALNPKPSPPVAPEVPLAMPVSPDETAEEVPLALPLGDEAEGPPLAEPVGVSPDEEPVEDIELEETPAAEVPAAPPQFCHVCGTQRKGDQSYCEDCGCFFPPPSAAPAAVAAPATPNSPKVSPAPSGGLLRGRYQLGERLNERLGIERFRGTDAGENGSGPSVSVLIVRGPAPAAPDADTPANDESDEEILPGFDMPTAAVVGEAGQPTWPSVAWERHLLESAVHPALPAVLDTFVDGEFDYVVEELPEGQLLWDAWDDPDATAAQQYGYLRQVAEGLHALHGAGAILEGLRPEHVVVTATGQARLADLSDLLPLPLPPDPPLRSTLYTAPELASFNGSVDARADLYSFGATIYALMIGRELTEKDLKVEGNGSPFIPRFPDTHPLFGRLLSKTLCKDPAGRFPSDEASREDPTGFVELLKVLDVCGRTLDTVRLEIAAWTTTGIVRTGNEDAFALLHGIESRQDDLGEAALVFLCDGMGGYEAGEIAAALTIQQLRSYLLQQPMFQFLSGQPHFPADGGKPDTNPAPFDVEGCKQHLKTALREANKYVFQASRSGVGRRGMGCTAEAVFVNNRHVVVGHVGDSRTYHLHEGNLTQLTRDQTLVNRLVELGHLSPEEAEDHPRKNELQQAVGGQPDVEPGLYHAKLKAGDWVVVCSDGVSNHVPPAELEEMLQMEATSAEMAARRLVNLVNLKGATDNATVVVIRAL